MNSASTDRESGEPGRLPLSYWQRRSRSLLRLCWLGIVLAYLGFAMAEALPQDLRAEGLWASRLYLALFMVQTFRFHIGVALALIAIVALCARRWRMLAAGAPVLLFAMWPALVSYVPKHVPALSGEPFTVMSVNLLAINRDTDDIVAEIAAADPDLLAMQEVTPRWRDAMAELVDQRYPHRAVSPRSDSFGIALYSRFPFVEPARSDLHVGTLGTPEVRAVVNVQGREVAVFDIHVMPPTSTRNSIEQRAGIADVIDLVRAESRPVILCGDFNMTEDSVYAARIRAAGLRDSHTLGGVGRGATWPNIGILRFAPGVRIDHIYLSGALTCVESRVGAGRGSDHRPIVAKVAFVK